jgi:hypothetical protein
MYQSGYQIFIIKIVDFQCVDNFRKENFLIGEESAKLEFPFNFIKFPRMFQRMFPRQLSGTWNLRTLQQSVCTANKGILRRLLYFIQWKFSASL